VKFLLHTAISSCKDEIIMILLEELDTEFGRIRITQSKRDGACTYYQNGCSHSEADAEGVSTCAYVHVLYGVIRQSGARRVLMAGCAGGTLATMLHRLGCEVTVVDINPHAFMLARRYFSLPEGVRCITGDGHAYLMDSPQRYDAVVLDVFNGSGHIPEEFTQPGFFRTVRHALTQNGVALMNVIVTHEHDTLADDIANGMTSAGLPAVLFDWTGGGDRNIVIAGGHNIAAMRIDCDAKPADMRYELKGLAGRKPKIA
jgi:spermidine synthase